MSRFIKGRLGLISAFVGAGFAGTASAAEVLVNANIASSTTWTANNTYNLQGQIYVLPGASLTIQAGTVVASDPGGSLAICKGAQIFVQGRQGAPVIMTSKLDVATWVGGNPKTGTWREVANEWGNLTIMGEAYISENAIGANTPAPNAANVADMEGLVNGPSTDRYGGGDDDDDSGSIAYLSLRYGGKVVGLNNELNGLSLGGIGRGTDIHHVEIMNNVDDGVEIWGGTVNLKYFSIWNIGDDSIDVDQGWRGKAQFGLIVQGHSLDAAQGSGVGDNVFETDGAEQSDYQPVTTSSFYNITAIGQPIDGDHAMAFRDNARIQYRNSIFMDVGERVVSFDNVDGDGGAGYGNNGTLTWAQTWSTAYNAVPSHGNDFTTGSYATNYPAQSAGNLNDVEDSVFFSNLFGTAYTEATTQGVFAGANNNVQVAGSNFTGPNYVYDAVNGPIASITRGAAVSKGGKLMLPVLTLDPRPINAAVTAIASAPDDGFFSPAGYRGAFEPGCTALWTDNWTASSAFGFTTATASYTNYCTAKVNSNSCAPSISFLGPNHVSVTNATAGLPGNFTAGNMSPRPGAAAHLGQLFYSTTGPNGAAFLGGTLCVKAPIKRIAPLVNTGGTVGSTTLCDSSVTQDFNARIASGLDAALVAGQNVWIQGWARDTAAFQGVQLSDAIAFTICP